MINATTTQSTIWTPSSKITLPNRTIYDPSSRSIERLDVVPNMDAFGGAEVFSIPNNLMAWTERSCWLTQGAISAEHMANKKCDFET